MSARRLPTDTARALYGAARRYGWNNRNNQIHERGVVNRYAGLAVTMATGFRPYAVAPSRACRQPLRHRARQVYVAWRAGRVEGVLVTIWCGSNLLTAELTDDRGHGRVCLTCELRAGTLLLPGDPAVEVFV